MATARSAESAESVASGAGAAEVAADDMAAAQAGKAERERPPAMQAHLRPLTRAARVKVPPAHPSTVLANTIMSRLLRKIPSRRPSRGSSASPGSQASHASRANRGNRGSHASRVRHRSAMRNPRRRSRISSLHRQRKAARRARRNRMLFGRPHRPIAPLRVAGAGRKNRHALIDTGAFRAPVPDFSAPAAASGSARPRPAQMPWEPFARAFQCPRAAPSIPTSLPPLRR